MRASLYNCVSSSQTYSRLTKLQSCIVPVVPTADNFRRISKLRSIMCLRPRAAPIKYMHAGSTSFSFSFSRSIFALLALICRFLLSPRFRLYPTSSRFFFLIHRLQSCKVRAEATSKVLNKSRHWARRWRMSCVQHRVTVKVDFENNGCPSTVLSLLIPSVTTFPS